MRTATPAQKAKAAERRERFRALAKTVGEMSEDDRRALAARMPVTTIEGHPLSVHNACLVITQCATASIVGGFQQWLKAGRCVTKGQHGLSIWVPIGKKRKTADGETTTEKTGFVPGTVFDISQTVEIGGQE